MRIVIDMQGAQTESRFRGIGRYTMSFVQAVVRNCGEHEVILVLNGLFSDTIESIREAFDGLLPQENIRVWHAPGPVKEELTDNDSRREVAELIREAFLASLQADVIHITSLFEGYVDDAVTSIGRFDTTTPVSVILYDLIPLQNHDRYFKPNPRYEQYYLRKIDYLRQAEKYLAISNFSRTECLETLNFADETIVNISTAIDDYFKPQTIDEETTVQVMQKFGIRRAFLLYTGGADERKNLPRLIEAYAAMPENLRETHQLVFAGKMTTGEVAGFQHTATACRLQNGELLFTGYITDEELVQLYNLCALYVFPSWHEGFGLPALEAMACGALVVGANSSSLPEVIGLDEALFDPFDVTSISAKIEQALTDQEFRHRLHEHSLIQTKKFSWDETAKRTILVWEGLSLQKNGGQDSWEKTSGKLCEVYQSLVQGITKAVFSVPTITDKDIRQMAVCLDRNERQLKDFLRADSLPQEITWRLEGPFDSSYSLALVNRETARALETLGHTVVLHSTEGPGDFPANELFLQQNPDLARMHQRVSTVSQVDANVTSRNLYPPRVSDMSSRLNILHGYAWEETGFPNGWVDEFNAYLQGITVTSKHVQKLLIDNGVRVPIAVTGNGVDHWERIIPEKTLFINARKFRFLHVSSCFPRKGADRMLEAYGRAFSSDDDVTLVIKTFKNPHNEIHKWLKDTRSNKANYPDVLIIEEDYSDSQLKGLFEQCHALVAPSRAEGFGLPMAEATLSGLAVVTTEWSGQLDFCTPKTSWLVDYQFERAQTHFNLFDSVWANPDTGHLAKTMREVYEMSDEVREYKVSAGRSLLLEKFRWSHVAERTVAAARSWSHIPEQIEPRIGWVTTWNTRCGIATYSEQLVKNMPSNVAVFAPRSWELTSQDQNNVYRCWIAGEQDPLNDLEKSIEHSKVNRLVIQFNYGFFNLDFFAFFLETQIQAGKVIVIMMHATTDPVHRPHKQLANLVPALARCHRLLVHSPNDMNRLKDYGLVENVTLFPHGIPHFAPQTTPSVKGSETFVVGSYGFFLPHKGLLELIEAIALLRDEGVPVVLEMVNAEHPAPESKMLIKKAKRKIKSLHLGDAVSVCTDYLEDDVCLSKLAGADLIVFPYQKTGESSSAAVRYGLATGKPVAVTPLDIFEDVSSVVFQLPGQKAQDIAEGIKKLRIDLNGDNPAASTINDFAEQWRTQHRYSAIGPRLNNMLYAIGNDA